MRFLIKAFLLIALLVIGSAVVLPFLPGGQHFLDRVEAQGPHGIASGVLSLEQAPARNPSPQKTKSPVKRTRGSNLARRSSCGFSKKKPGWKSGLRIKQRFKRFASYPICYYSGRLGPKQKQGDRQAPEGFYTVAKHQLNPNSRWHRSFNLGYPNLFDRFHKRTGDYLMVHGGCSSIGCYAMTNDVIDEIWTIVTQALDQQPAAFCRACLSVQDERAQYEALS